MESGKSKSQQQIAAGSASSSRRRRRLANPGAENADSRASGAKPSEQQPQSSTADVTRTFTGVPPADRLGTPGCSQQVKPTYVQARGDDVDLRNPSQQWMVLSFVGPQGTAVKAREVMIKISSGFPTPEAADEHAVKIRSQPHHTIIDTAVVTMNEWITVPIPANILSNIKKHYVNQPVIDKLMDGQWKSSEEGRRNVQKREMTTKERNRRRLKALYGEDYEQPTQNKDVQAQEETRLAESKPEDSAPESTKTLSISDVVVSFAKYMINEKRKKQQQGSDVGTSDTSAATIPAAGVEEETSDREKKGKEPVQRFSASDLDAEVREQVNAFRQFMISDTQNMEELVRKVSAVAAAEEPTGSQQKTKP